MGEIVNLRAARKRKGRADREAAAAVNRASFGQKRSEKDRAKLSRHVEDKKLEGHRLERPAEGGETP